MKNIERILSNKKRMEFLRYGVFGVATTVINIVVYQILIRFMDYRISNLIAILASKTFAYITNKLFVFNSHCKTKKELLQEVIRFVLARGATGLIDYFGLIFAVSFLHFDKVWSKYVLQVIVIIMNYVLGKKAVFLSGDTERED